MAARVLHVPWYENASRTATWSVTAGMEDSLLPATHLGNGLPSLGARILATQGAWRAAHGSAVSVPVVGLIHHSLDAGLAVRFEGSDDPAFGTTVYSEAITIGARRIDGYRNDWLDVETAVGGAVTATLYQRIVVDAGANSVNLAIGEVVLGTVRNLAPWILYQGAGLAEDIDVVEHRTVAGVSHRHPQGFPIAGYLGARLLPGTEIDAAIDVFRGLGGRARPWFIVPAPAEDLCHFGLFGLRRLGRVPLGPSLQRVDFVFEELSRGLTWSAVP